MLAAIDRYFEEVLCTVALSLVAGCVMLQVVLRYVFAAASPWAEELAVYGMIFAVYLGASMATRDRAHIRITLLVNALPRKLQVASVVLADAMWFGFMIFLTWQSTLYVKLLFEVTYISPGLGIEQKWVQIFLPFAMILMMFRIAQVYWRWRNSEWRGLPL